MDFRLGREEIDFRREVRQFLAERMRPDLVQRQGMAISQERIDLITEMAERGWLALGWPPEYGGRPGSPHARFILNEELAYAGAPNIGIGLSVGQAILRWGDEDQRRRFIPQILANEILFGYGYSEPEVGSDLAALRTRAIRDDDGYYLVNGRKLFITPANYADYLWTAVRTNPDEPRHAGISVLIVDLAAPGVEVRELRTLGAWRTNEVVFDDVRVDVSSRVGPEHGGWPVIGTALNDERLYPHAPLRRTLEQITEWLGHTGRDRDPEARRLLARLATGVEASHALFLRQVDQMVQGDDSTVQAAMNKLWNAEFEVEMMGTAIELLGEEALIEESDPDAILGGVFEKDWRGTILGPIAGGSSEVQRNIIARHGLGLPRYA